MHITDELKRNLSDESGNMPEEETDSGTESDESEESYKKSGKPSNESEINEPEKFSKSFLKSLLKTD